MFSAFNNFVKNIIVNISSIEIVDKCEIHFWDILKKERTMLKCEQYIDS